VPFADQEYRVTPMGRPASDVDPDIFNDKNLMVADTRSRSAKRGRVYVVRTRFEANDTPVGGRVGEQCLPPNGYRVPPETSMSISVDRNGNLYATWADFRNGGPPCDPLSRLVVSAAAVQQRCLLRFLDHRRHDVEPGNQHDGTLRQDRTVDAVARRRRRRQCC
jgi:hypothetical protein